MVSDTKRPRQIALYIIKKNNTMSEHTVPAFLLCKENSSDNAGKIRYKGKNAAHDTTNIP